MLQLLLASHCQVATLMLLEVPGPSVVCLSLDIQLACASGPTGSDLFKILE